MSATPSIHEPRGVQHYAAQVAWLGSALAADESLATQLVEAVHTGSAARVERVFRSIGLDAPTSISTTESSGDEVEFAPAASSARTTTVTLKIGFGPVSVSVTFTKESKGAK